MINRIGFVLLFCLFAMMGTAQEFAYGFKVGLNFSTLQADSEMDANGNSLETFDYNSGFHVGAAFIYRITDLVGVKGEFLFNQKGVKYAYDGPSFQIFTDDLGNQILSENNASRTMFLEVVNSYIDIPITAYYKFGDKIEIYGGFDVGFLVGSSAVGELTYRGEIPGFPNVDEVFELDFNYFGNEPASPSDITENTEIAEIKNNNRTIAIPRKLGAYYLDYPEKDGSYYNIIDVGLTGGLAFYINSGLFVSGTVNYGLTDATNNFYDISRLESNGLEYISRSDKDTNLSFMASIGFAF